MSCWHTLPPWVYSITFSLQYMLKLISSTAATNHCKLQELITTGSLFVFSHYQPESKWQRIYALVPFTWILLQELRAQLWRLKSLLLPEIILRTEISIKRITRPKPLIKEAFFSYCLNKFFFTTQKTGYSEEDRNQFKHMEPDCVYSLEKTVTPKVAGRILYPEGRVADHHVH